MIDHMGPPVVLRLPDHPPDDLDGLLSAYFQEEMPTPWPAWSPPQTNRPADVGRSLGPKRWLAVRRRLAVAASVAALLVGYLVLAQAFPSAGESKMAGTVDQQNVIGKGLDVPKGNPRMLIPFDNGPGKEVDVPKGGRARMWENRRPDGRLQLFIRDLDNPHQRR
jgi:hypothetical protein